MKRIVVLIVLLILASMIAGCGGDEVASTNGNQETVTSVEPAPAANIAVSAQMPTQLSEQEILAAMPANCIGWLQGYSYSPYYLCENQWTPITLMDKKPTVNAPYGHIRVEIYTGTEPSTFREWENGAILDLTNVPGDFQAMVTLVKE